jgi:penicillin V acylase-like amidase (Ntn superfamily)
MIARTAFAAASLTAVALLSFGGPVQDARACTRIFANDKGDAMLVARSMDWATTTEPVLTVFPRGLIRNGGNAGPMTVVADNPAHWTSQYGSVVTTIFGIGTADGVNERGLAAHMLYFPPADYGPRDLVKPGVQAALWAQYAQRQCRDR